METINDIIDEMRRGMIPKHRHDRELLLNFADRIEAAHKREREAVGNVTKMREALETISKCDISKEEDCYTIYRVCEAALSAPPRNCDLYKSEPEAYQAYLTAMKNATKKTYVYFEPWLFAEAKGGAE
jgi:hypothetical protein